MCEVHVARAPQIKHVRDSRVRTRATEAEHLSSAEAVAGGANEFVLQERPKEWTLLMTGGLSTPTPWRAAQNMFHCRRQTQTQRHT